MYVEGKLCTILKSITRLVFPIDVAHDANAYIV
jgi:hypothetical protein